MDWYVARKLPAVLGHEPVGEILAVGEGVDGVRPGDRVALHHHAPCGECRRCRRGHETLCERFRAVNLDPGGFAERVRVPAELVGELVTMLALCYAGDIAEGERVLKPLRSFGRPLVDLIATMPYTALQSASDASYPNGQRNYWKSHYVDQLTDDVVAEVMEHAERMTSPLSSFYFQHLGGAIDRAGRETAAFGHRGAGFDFTILTVWNDPTEDAEQMAWARDFFTALQPYSTGVYVNNLGSEGADRVKAAYAPETYQRLVELKTLYDPENTFRLNQNVAPRPNAGDARKRG
jgi:FAD/FMN-containing dehydrogenase